MAKASPSSSKLTRSTWVNFTFMVVWMVGAHPLTTPLVSITEIVQTLKLNSMVTSLMSLVPNLVPMHNGLVKMLPKKIAPYQKKAMLHMVVSSLTKVLMNSFIREFKHSIC